MARELANGRAAGETPERRRRMDIPARACASNEQACGGAREGQIQELAQALLETAHFRYM